MHRVNSDWLGALLDTHVVYQAGETPRQWFDIFGDRIFHVRLSDGRSDGYRVWGEGCHPLRETLNSVETAGYGGLMTLYCPNGRYASEPNTAEQKNRRTVELAGKTDEIEREQIAGMNQHYRHYRYEAYLDNMCDCGITSLEMWCGSPHVLLDSGDFTS